MIPAQTCAQIRFMRVRLDAAEANLACIADALNTIARETGQREEFDYLGHCTLRDALNRIVYTALEHERSRRPFVMPVPGMMGG